MMEKSRALRNQAGNMTTDPIADLLTRIKNAGMAGKNTATIPFSKMKMGILELLKKEGYVADFKEKGKKVIKNIEVDISYYPTAEGKRPTPRIQGARRVSKQSKRLYRGVDQIKPVKFGKGLLVLSTPKGILSGKDARKENVGGEPLFTIW